MEGRVCRQVRIPFVLSAPFFWKRFLVKTTRRMKFISLNPQKETAPVIEAVVTQIPTMGKNFQAAKITNNSLQTSTLPKKSGPIVLALATATTDEKKPLHQEHILPTWGLPQRWQDIIEEVAFCKNAPRDYCVAAMIGTVASILRKRVKLTYNEFVNYPCMWLILVGNSSKGKSPVLSWFWRPLKDWCNEVNREYDRAVAEWKKQGGEGTRPTPKDFVIQDMTAEARNYAMKRNDEQGVAVLADELGSFLGCLARYSGTTAKEISDLNSVYISNPIKIDRVDVEKRLTINEPFLSITGGVQEDRIGKYFGNELMTDSGFVQRCMFVFPEDSARTRNKASISEDAEKEWTDSLANLLALDCPTIELALDEEAVKLFGEYSDKLSDKEDAAENSYLVSLYSKQRYFVLRWAEVVAFINSRDLDNNCKVTGDDMRYSIECAEYFEHCALKVYDLIRMPEKKQVVSNPELVRLMNERFKLKDGCQNQLASCFCNLSQSAISLALSGKR